MRFSRLLPIAAATLFSHQAFAYTIDVLSPGTLFPSAQYGAVATFDSIAQTPYGLIAPTPAFTDAGAAFSGLGVVMNNAGQGSDGLYATPFGDSTNYLAVLGGGSETIAYASQRTSFGLYWGSVDTYNVLNFYDGATLVATVTGAQIPPLLAANGGQLDWASNGYVLVRSLPKFDSVVVSSLANSFEFDNVVAGVPEPSTWAMLGVGFLGLASLAVRRGRRDRLAPGIA